MEIGHPGSSFTNTCIYFNRVICYLQKWTFTSLSLVSFFFTMFINAAVSIWHFARAHHLGKMAGGISCLDNLLANCFLVLTNQVIINLFMLPFISPTKSAQAIYFSSVELAFEQITMKCPL